MSTSNLVKLAYAAGVHVEWLAIGEGPMMLDSDVSTTGSFATNEPIAHYAVGPSTSQVMDTQGNPVCLEEFAFIPRYNLKASAGYGASTDGEKPLFTMAFRKYWIDNYLRCQPSDLSVISVKGDSMEGVLNDRDVILINHTDNDPGTGLYVLRMDGDLIVKRVQRIPGGKIKVTSANTAYEPFEVDLANLPNDFSIIGRVVWFGRQI
ncbi:S24 family peptidase [Paludibacterium denitrificans]|nr:helix-turn-helix transcriptional regulator [Paludibacterium denitrificans]